ncbi:cytochrome c oxidase subunit II [Vulcanococcus limneticus Candia 3F8]|uniref:cytochrome c oxidase subunit II n=1 Tax=Vulcanococcus limneticus TaxID=2170428 RepID=UPI000B987392|nr:cytochrome c oxidase subunit II [Vulcanococcus limneticus]MCP9790820.1 cytochrome c oxidase subunit II [Vulcanococcus limneticus MW73D5]MCP9892837.1 cytochrome c oxidase subunit II [Vulcanococcus limneticus Candia 3F8]MCP9896427.1 cytochrome c oxidase subunit II [Vulcanococcus limneticus Candia 3B3]
MLIPAPVLSLIIGMVLVLSGLWIGQNVNLLPVDASSNAPVYDELFKVLFSIGAILFLGIVGLLVFSLVRFRRRPGELGDGIALEGNLPLEIVWTAIPAIVVLFVGIYSYDIYERMGGMVPLNDHAVHAMQHEAHGGEGGAAMAAMAGGGIESDERIWGGITPASADALTVDVTAMQFAFIFRYPDSEIISGELHVPAGRPVALRMKANDVIHAFWVPQFRLKQDVIPGQPTLLSFTPTRPGSYPIICAELCGPYHGGMRTTVVVEEPENFQAWVSKNSPNPPPAPVTPVVAAAAAISPLQS